jgi:hypothetical protein
VNPGQLIAALGLAQLMIALYFDRTFGTVERPPFRDAVERYDALGMKAWFTAAKVGDTRTDEVLRLTRLPHRHGRHWLRCSFHSLVA